MLTSRHARPAWLLRSYAFAMMSLKEEDAHNDLTGVPDEHLKILDDWYDKLTEKYPTPFHAYTCSEMVAPTKMKPASHISAL